MAEQIPVHLKKIDAYRWLIPREGGCAPMARSMPTIA